MKYLKLSLTTCLFITGLSNSLHGQALVISPNPIVEAVCPLASAGLPYFVTTTSGGLPSCTYTWNITSGSFFGSNNTGTNVKVIWNDAQGTGTLTVTSASCQSTDDNGKTATATYVRKSIFGKQFTNTCTNSISLPNL